MASRAVAHVAICSSKNESTKLVEGLLNSADEHLQNADKSFSNENKRLSAVLVNKELATSIPSSFYQHTRVFFENIFKIVNDTRVSDVICRSFFFFTEFLFRLKFVKRPLLLFGPL